MCLLQERKCSHQGLLTLGGECDDARSAIFALLDAHPFLPGQEPEIARQRGPIRAPKRRTDTVSHRDGILWIYGYLPPFLLCVYTHNNRGFFFCQGGRLYGKKETVLAWGTCSCSRLYAATRSLSWLFRGYLAKYNEQIYRLFFGVEATLFCPFCNNAQKH